MARRSASRSTRAGRHPRSRTARGTGRTACLSDLMSTSGLWLGRLTGLSENGRVIEASTVGSSGGLQQPEGPDAEGATYQDNEGHAEREPWVGRRRAPFKHQFEHMSCGEEAEDDAGGQEIGLQNIPPRCKVVAQAAIMYSLCTRPLLYGRVVTCWSLMSRGNGPNRGTPAPISTGTRVITRR